MTNTTKPDTTTPEALQAEKALAEQAAAGEKRFDIGQFGEEVRRVMVVAAHPDDLETACGGHNRPAGASRGRGDAGAGHRRRYWHP